MQIDLNEKDIDELRQAISAYREHMIRMARAMDDTRYLNSLPWMEEFRLRLLGYKEAMQHD